MASPHIRQKIALTLLINVLIPVALYRLLSPHMSTLHALMIVALIPVLENVVTLARHRRLDGLGMLVLAGIVIGVFVLLLGGSPRLILARESLVLGGIGLVVLASLLLPRPLLFYLASSVVSGNDPERMAQYQTRWQDARFRTFMRLLTLVCGLCLVAESAINTYLAFALPIATFLAVSQFVRYGLAGVILLSTVVLARRYGQIGGQAEAGVPG